MSSEAFAKLKNYCEEHNSATLLLRIAAQDYSATRCLLQHGLATGFSVGAQAIEKILKAYLLFANPKRDVKRLSHSLPKLLAEANSLYPHLGLSQFSSLAEKFGRHYATRYPDNPDASVSLTTGDLIDLDVFVIFLNENMPCPRHVKYRSGLYAAVTFSLGYNATIPPTEYWIKINNRAFAPLWPRITSDYNVIIRELYP